MPRVVKFVFWRYISVFSVNLQPADQVIQRIILFYLLSILLIGLNGMYVFVCNLCYSYMHPSSLGLSQLVEQEYDNVSFHRRLQRSRLK
jgi:hypothetical protein